MSITASINLKTTLAKALGLELKNDLEAVFAVCGKSFAFSLSAEEVDLTKLISAEPDFKLKLQSVCAFVLHLTDEKQKKLLLSSVPHLADYFDKLESLPAEVQTLLTCSKKNSANSTEKGPLQVPSQIAPRGSSASAPGGSAVAAGSPAAEGGTASSFENSLFCCALISIQGSFLSDLLRIGYEDSSQGSADQLFLAAAFDKSANLKDALFAASLPSFTLFNLLTFENIALSFRLKQASAENRSLTLRAGTASASASPSSWQEEPGKYLVTQDFQTLRAELAAALGPRITQDFCLQGKITLSVESYQLVFLGALNVSSCYTLGELSLMGDDGKTDPERSLSLLDGKLSFFKLRLAALKVYADDKSSSKSAFAILAAVNFTETLELEASLLCEKDASGKTSVSQASIFLNTRLSFADLLNKIAGVTVEGFDLAIQDGSFLSYQKNNASYDLSCRLKLELKILSLDLKPDFTLKVLKEGQDSYLEGDVQLAEPLKFLNLFEIRQKDGPSASPQASGPEIYFRSSRGSTKTLAIGFKGELVFLKDLKAAFDAALTRSGIQESITCKCSVSLAKFAENKLNFTLTYAVDGADTSGRSKLTFKLDDSFLDQKAVNVLKELCAVIDGLPLGSGCEEISKLSEKLGTEIEKNERLKHKITPLFNFDNPKQVGISFNITLGTGDLSPDNIFLSKTFDNEGKDLITIDFSADLTFSGLVGQLIDAIPEALTNFFKELFINDRHDGDVVNISKFLEFLFPSVAVELFTILTCKTSNSAVKETAKRSSSSKPSGGQKGGTGGKGSGLGWSIGAASGGAGSSFFGNLGLFAGGLFAAGAFIAFAVSSSKGGSFSEDRKHNEDAQRLNPLYQRGFLQGGAQITMADGSRQAVENLRPGDAVLGADGKSHKILGVIKSPLWEQPLLVPKSHPEDPGFTVYTPFKGTNSYLSPASDKTVSQEQSLDLAIASPEELWGRDDEKLGILKDNSQIYAETADHCCGPVPTPGFVLKDNGSQVTDFFYDLVLEDKDADFIAEGLVCLQNLWWHQNFTDAQLDFQKPLARLPNLALAKPVFCLDKLRLSWRNELFPSICTLSLQGYNADIRKLAPEQWAEHEIPSLFYQCQDQREYECNPLEIDFPFSTYDQYALVKFKRGNKDQNASSRDGSMILKVRGLSFKEPPAYYQASRRICLTLESLSCRNTDVRNTAAERTLAPSVHSKQLGVRTVEMTAGTAAAEKADPNAATGQHVGKSEPSNLSTCGASRIEPCLAAADAEPRIALLNIFQGERLLAQNLKVVCNEPFTYTFKEEDAPERLTDETPLALEAMLTDGEEDEIKLTASGEELFYDIGYCAYHLVSEEKQEPPQPEPEPSPEPEPQPPEPEPEPEPPEPKPDPHAGDHFYPLFTGHDVGSERSILNLYGLSRAGDQQSEDAAALKVCKAISAVCSQLSEYSAVSEAYILSTLELVDKAVPSALSSEEDEKLLTLYRRHRDLSNGGQSAPPGVFYLAVGFIILGMSAMLMHEVLSRSAQTTDSEVQAELSDGNRDADWKMRAEIPAGVQSQSQSQAHAQARADDGSLDNAGYILEACGNQGEVNNRISSDGAAQNNDPAACWFNPEDLLLAASKLEGINEHLAGGTSYESVLAWFTEDERLLIIRLAHLTFKLVNSEPQRALSLIAYFTEPYAAALQGREQNFEITLLMLPALTLISFDKICSLAAEHWLDPAVKEFLTELRKKNATFGMMLDLKAAILWCTAYAKTSKADPYTVFSSLLSCISAAKECRPARSSTEVNNSNGSDTVMGSKLNKTQEDRSLSFQAFANSDLQHEALMTMLRCGFSLEDLARALTAAKIAPLSAAQAVVKAGTALKELTIQDLKLMQTAGLSAAVCLNWALDLKQIATRLDDELELLRNAGFSNSNIVSALKITGITDEEIIHKFQAEGKSPLEIAQIFALAISSSSGETNHETDVISK